MCRLGRRSPSSGRRRRPQSVFSFGRALTQAQTEKPPEAEGSTIHTVLASVISSYSNRISGGSFRMRNSEKVIQKGVPWNERRSLLRRRVQAISVRLHDVRSKLLFVDHVQIDPPGVVSGETPVARDRLRNAIERRQEDEASVQEESAGRMTDVVVEERARPNRSVRLEDVSREIFRGITHGTGIVFFAPRVRPSVSFIQFSNVNRHRASIHCAFRDCKKTRSNRSPVRDETLLQTIHLLRRETGDASVGFGGLPRSVTERELCLEDGVPFHAFEVLDNDLRRQSTIVIEHCEPCSLPCFRFETICIRIPIRRKFRSLGTTCWSRNRFESLLVVDIVQSKQRLGRNQFVQLHNEN